jgi:UDPglucose 6-dehydrogenase
MKIGVIGTGYVGMVTAVCLADIGHDVIGTDIDKEKIDKASQGVSHIYEHGLEDLLKKNLKKGNLSFSHALEDTILASDVLFVCVNTPQREDGSADMCYVESTSRSIAENLNKYKLVVEKSTVPVQTSMWIKRTISLYKKGNGEFDVASNPEFLREGTAISDFMHPDRVIIGAETKKAQEILVKIYKKFKDKILVTNIDTAELIKHASNSFLAMKISFINLMAELCERTDADVELVAKGMGLDPRIVERFLRALIKIGEDLGADLSLLKEVDRINTERIQSFLGKIKKALWIVKDKKISVLGLAFKPETDDIRNAPTISLINELQSQEALLRLYDPKAMDNMKSIFPEDPPKVIYVDNPYDAVKEANALLLVTEWDEFRSLDLNKVRNLMANPILIDGRNVFDPDKVRRLGFEYYSIGRK